MISITRKREDEKTMSTSLVGRLSGTLSAPLASDADGHTALISLINDIIRPPQALRPEQVYIRSMRLVSDAVNDHGGRFPAEEHERLSALLIDSPVLIGHDRSRLPVARNFAAQTRQEEGQSWVQVWFYWMRSADGDRLATDIDGGVVKEGSLGFEFRRPQCSICAKDIRQCEHIPGEPYRDAQNAVSIAHYEYRDIVRVLETSLVYRGATPGTRIGNEPLFSKLGVSHDSQPPHHGLILSCHRLTPRRFRCIVAGCDQSGTPSGAEFVCFSHIPRRIGDRVALSPKRTPVSRMNRTENSSPVPADFRCGSPAAKNPVTP